MILLPYLPHGLCGSSWTKAPEPDRLIRLSLLLLSLVIRHPVPRGCSLSGVGFSGEERRGVIPAKAGIQEKGRQSWWKRLDARLRGHDGLAYACGPQTRDTGGLDEKPTLMRGAPPGRTWRSWGEVS